MAECAEDKEQKMEANIFVKTLAGKRIMLNLGSPEEMQKMTVLQVKEKILEKEGIPEGEQLLIFNGQQMKNSELLSEYKVQHGETIFIVLKLRGGHRTQSQENLADFLDPESESESESEYFIDPWEEPKP